jgi:3-hydroxybutyryl-CoA dehydratase
MADTKGYFLEDLAVGMSAAYSKTVTEADIEKFAEVSGDNNPLHLDEDFAKTTRFKGRIAHGMLSAGFISTILGTQLPGPGSVYMSQSLRFTAPVRIGDTVTARAEITGIRADRKRVTLVTTCAVGDKVVIEGEALVLVPSRA